jgi:protein ImuA
MIRPLIPDRLRTTPSPADDKLLITFGDEATDARIGGGLMQQALHEFFAASVDDGNATACLAAMLAVRSCPVGRPVIWVRESRCSARVGRLYAAGLHELGCDPGRILLVDAPDSRAVLRAGADIVKCGQVGAVIVEPWGKAPLLDLSASRRLSIAAANSGVPVLVVRVDAAPAPSAAQTRWQIASAPSLPLAGGAPGHPAFDIALLRHRGGFAGFEARLEWNRDIRSFAALSGGVPAAAAVRADRHERRAA